MTCIAKLLGRDQIRTEISFYSRAGDRKPRRTRVVKGTPIEALDRLRVRFKPGRLERVEARYYP